jgi:hypothetical protein
MAGVLAIGGRGLIGSRPLEDRLQVCFQTAVWDHLHLVRKI